MVVERLINELDGMWEEEVVGCYPGICLEEPMKITKVC